MSGALEMLEPPHAEALGHVLEKAEAADGAVVHDPDHPLEQRFLQGLLDRAGMTSERYPAKFAAMTAPGDPDEHRGDQVEGAFSDGELVECITIDEHGRTCAQALLTRTKQLLTGTVTLTVTNQVGDAAPTIVAEGTGVLWKQQTILVRTNPVTAKPYPEEGETKALLSWEITYADHTVERPRTTVSVLAHKALSDPVLTAPVKRPDRTKGDPHHIMVGLSRALGDRTIEDVDYWFHRSDWENTELLVPLAGSMQFSEGIAPLREDPDDPNPVLSFTLAKSEGGLSHLEPKDLAPYRAGFKRDPTVQGRLNFSLEATETSDGNAINFGLSPWSSETRTYLSATVSVELDDGSIGVSTVVSSDEKDEDAWDGIAKIKPLVYVWHCVVGGTEVMLADGTAKPIEACQVGDVIRDAGEGPGTWDVMATLAQPHTGTLYTVVVEPGRRITCSGTHPFVDPDSGDLIQAADLKPDASFVRVLHEVERVVEVTVEEVKDVMLFNLWLDAPRGSGATRDVNALFYANGYVTGDYACQVELLARNRRPDALRATLPEHLHRDFDSWVEDQAITAV